jgi:hypothetical protein
MNTGYHFTTWLSRYLVTCLHLGNKSERFFRHSVFFALIMSSFSSRHKLHRLDSGLYALTFFMMCKPVEKLRGHNHLVWLTNKDGLSFLSFLRVEFYPSITESLLDRAIAWGQQFPTPISGLWSTRANPFFSRKSFLERRSTFWATRQSWERCYLFVMLMTWTNFLLSMPGASC